MGNLGKYLKPFSKEIQGLVEQILQERNELGNATYESASRLMELGVEEDADMLIGIAYYHLAEQYLQAEKVELASQNLTSSIKYLQSTGPYEYIARAYNLLGLIMLFQENVVMAMEALENAMKCCVEHRLIYVKAIVLNNIAICYQHIYKTDEALQYYDKAISQYMKAKKGADYRLNYLNCIISKATLLLFLNRVEEAEEYKEEIEEYFRENQLIFEASIFMAVYCWKTGAEEALQFYVKQCEKELSAIQFLYSNDSVKFFLELLTQMRDYETLIRSVETILQSFDMVTDSEFLLEILKLRLTYGMEYMSKEQLQAGISKFFKIYDEYHVNQGETTIRDLEMKRRLREIEESQYELKLLNAELLQHARHDGLTELPNRGYLNEYAEKSFERAKKIGTIFGICFLDIDYFKQLNDYYGHLSGDECLISIAAILKDYESSGVFCARYGGDEFTILFEGKTSKEIETTLKNIQNDIEKLHMANINSPITKELTASMGCFCRVPETNDRLWDFFSAADNVLYKVKEGGRNHYQIEENFEK